jgi:hypothetical protein
MNTWTARGWFGTKVATENADGTWTIAQTKGDVSKSETLSASDAHAVYAWCRREGTIC